MKKGKGTEENLGKAGKKGEKKNKGKTIEEREKQFSTKPSKQ